MFIECCSSDGFSAVSLSVFIGSVLSFTPCSGPFSGDAVAYLVLDISVRSGAVVDFDWAWQSSLLSTFLVLFSLGCVRIASSMAIGLVSVFVDSVKSRFGIGFLAGVEVLVSLVVVWLSFMVRPAIP